jgi:hypothetical protein
MICKKCGGQGKITRLCQTDDGYEIPLALLSFGTSLIFTTTTREITCDRCYGTGETGK